MCDFFWYIQTFRNIPYVHLHEKRKNEDTWHGAEIQVIIEGNWTTHRVSTLSNILHKYSSGSVIFIYLFFLFFFVRVYRSCLNSDIIVVVFSSKQAWHRSVKIKLQDNKILMVSVSLVCLLAYDFLYVITKFRSLVPESLDSPVLNWKCSR